MTEPLRQRAFYLFIIVAVGMMVFAVMRDELTRRAELWQWLARYAVGVVQANPLLSLLMVMALAGLMLLVVVVTKEVE